MSKNDMKHRVDVTTCTKSSIIFLDKKQVSFQKHMLVNSTRPLIIELDFVDPNAI